MASNRHRSNQIAKDQWLILFCSYIHWNKELQHKFYWYGGRFPSENKWSYGFPRHQTETATAAITML